MTNTIIYSKKDYTLYKFNVDRYAISYEDFTICRYPIKDTTTIAEDLAEFLKTDYKKDIKETKELLVKEIKEVIAEFEKVNK